MDGLALVTFALYSISRWLVRGRQKIYDLGNQLAWLEYNLNLWNAADERHTITVRSQAKVSTFLSCLATGSSAARERLSVSSA